jgi:phage terminase small subunit
MGLTSKQQVFISEYLQCWNASEAARRAGYSVKTARVIGSENLTKPAIAAEIKARIDELKMSADEVLIRLSDQARASMAEFVVPETDSISLIKAEIAGKLHLIKKFSHTVTDKSKHTSIELYDAQAALVQLGRAHGLFTDNVHIEDVPLLILDR